MGAFFRATDAPHTHLHNLQSSGIRKYSVGQVGQRIVVQVAILDCRGNMTSVEAGDNV